MSKESIKSVLLCGAGAEADLGLPEGANFTWDTYFTKKENLYNALKEFYKDCRNPSYVKGFLFKSDGYIFRELVNNLYKQNQEFFKKNGIDFNPDWINEDDKKNQTGESEDKESKKKNAAYKNVYDLLIVEQHAEKRNDNFDIDQLVASIGTSYFGTLESYFYTIIDPNNGSGKYWRLVNYYWSAFFSIAAPLISGFDENECSEEWYKNVLGDICQAINNIYSNSPDHITETCYYKQMRDKFDFVITTNYTPFCEYLFSDSKRGKDNVAYLAGKLSLFEYPKTRDIVDVRDENIRVDDLKINGAFPFLMTQAPVKPIIHPKQIEEYHKAISALEKAKYLVVLGYSFSNNDAHIQTLARNFLVNGKQQKRKLIFVDYGCEKGPDVKLKEILDILCIEEKDQDKVQIIRIKDNKSGKNYAEYLKDRLAKIGAIDE